MKAMMRTDSMGNITVYMSGDLDYETPSYIQKELSLLKKTYPSGSITLDLSKLDFVGSCGISNFMEALKTIYQQTQNLKIMNVSDEFRKVLELYDAHTLAQILIEFDQDIQGPQNEDFVRTTPFTQISKASTH
jgi:anti-sigma B factor antagonist